MLPGFPVTITLSGPSQDFNLPQGDQWLVFRSTNWTGTTGTLQVSPDGSAGSYADARDASGNPITINNNWNFPVAGGMLYRLNVATIGQPIVVSARRAAIFQ